MKIFKKITLPAIALALTTASGCLLTAPPLPSKSTYHYGNVFILAESNTPVESNQKIGNEGFCDNTGQNKDMAWLGRLLNSKIHSLQLEFNIDEDFAEYTEDNTVHWNTCGLGTLTNKGDKPIYVLTGTLEDPHAVEKIIITIYPNDNRHPPYSSRIMPPPSVAQVREIVEKYRSVYKPASVGSTADFPGLTTINPDETKPVVHASIAPVEWKESEKGSFPGADILRGRSNR